MCTVPFVSVRNILPFYTDAGPGKGGVPGRITRPDRRSITADNNSNYLAAGPTRHATIVYRTRVVILHYCRDTNGARETACKYINYRVPKNYPGCPRPRCSAAVYSCRCMVALSGRRSTRKKRRVRHTKAVFTTLNVPLSSDAVIVIIIIVINIIII